MKKMLMLAVAAAAALSFAPASAAPGTGCTATGGATNAATSCTFVATGAEARVASATPNSWSVTVVRNNVTVTLASSASAQLPSSSVIAPALAGETVTVTMGPDCVPGDFVCGSIGSVSVFETA